MSSSFVVIKTPYSPEGVHDPLEIDSDPAFKTQDYQKLAEALLGKVAWSGSEGTAEFSGATVGLQASDACLFVNVVVGNLGPEQTAHLAARSLELGALVMDGDTTELISAGTDLL